MTTTDQHAVFVTFDGGATKRVTAWLDWTEAIATWTAMDDQRREVQKAGGKVRHNDLVIRHYEVRSAQDPAYAALPQITLERGFNVLSREYASMTYAAKAVLRPLGYHAKSGGWVYEGKNADGSDCVVNQGWVSTALSVGHRVVRLPGEKGYRATVTTSLLVAQEA